MCNSERSTLLSNEKFLRTRSDLIIIEGLVDFGLRALGSYSVVVGS